MDGRRAVLPPLDERHKCRCRSLEYADRRVEFPYLSRKSSREHGALRRDDAHALVARQSCRVFSRDDEHSQNTLVAVVGGDIDLLDDAQRLTRGGIAREYDESTPVRKKKGNALACV